MQLQLTHDDANGRLEAFVDFPIRRNGTSAASVFRLGPSKWKYIEAEDHSIIRDLSVAQSGHRGNGLTLLRRTVSDMTRGWGKCECSD